MNPIYASENGNKLAIFEGESNHMLLFEYKPEEDIIEVSMMRGAEVEGIFRIDVHDNQLGRRYEEIIGLKHYLERILDKAIEEDKKSIS